MTFSRTAPFSSWLLAGAATPASWSALPGCGAKRPCRSSGLRRGCRSARPKGPSPCSLIWLRAKTNAKPQKPSNHAPSSNSNLRFDPFPALHFPVVAAPGAAGGAARRRSALLEHCLGLVQLAGLQERPKPFLDITANRARIAARRLPGPKPRLHRHHLVLHAQLRGVGDRLFSQGISRQKLAVSGQRLLAKGALFQ